MSPQVLRSPSLDRSRKSNESKSKSKSNKNNPTMAAEIINLLHQGIVLHLHSSVIINHHPLPPPILAMTPMSLAKLNLVLMKLHPHQQQHHQQQLHQQQHPHHQRQQQQVLLYQNYQPQKQQLLIDVQSIILARILTKKQLCICMKKLHCMIVVHPMIYVHWIIQTMYQVPRLIYQDYVD